MKDLLDFSHLILAKWKLILIIRLYLRKKYRNNGDYSYTNLNNNFWYFSLLIPPAEFEDFTDDDYMDIRVHFGLRQADGSSYNRNSYLRVFRNNEGMPKNCWDITEVIRMFIPFLVKVY